MTEEVPKKGPAKPAPSTKKKPLTPQERLKRARELEIAKKKKPFSEEVAGRLPANAPGKLHEKYLKEVKKIDAKTRESYRSTMAGLKASKIRESSRILNKSKPGTKETGKQRILNLREEQARRIAAYTSECGPNSYILKYPSNQEYTIGCGEIFLCANSIKIERKDGGPPIIAKRMVTPSGRHKGRLAFCSVNAPHEYVATYSGDKVTILDNQERVNVNDAKAIAAHIKILDQEDATRKKHAAEYARTEEFYSSPSYTPGVGPYAKGGPMDLNVKIPKTKPSEIPGDDVLSELFNSRFLKKLNRGQKTNIGIIIQEFRNAGLPDGIAAAAIANSYAESGFRSIQSTCRVSSRGWNERGWHDAKGRLREDSWGLFQMNAPASVPMKKGMTEEQRAKVRARRVQFRKEMMNPRLNCKKVIRRIKSRRGRKLREAAARGASIAELTSLFCIYIEIPANRFKRGPQRGRMAMRMFKNVERPRINIAKKEITAKPGESISEKFSARPFKRNGVIKWTNGQEKAIFGSSSVSGVLHYHLSKNTARIGIGAYNAGNFFSHFKRHLWPRIKHFTPPKKVILAGFALNGIHTSGNADRVINKSIERHKKIIKFLKAWGVKEVLIATNQPYGGQNSKKRQRLNEFNRRIREQGLTNDSVDLAKKVAPNGKCLPGTLADGVHLSKKAGKMAARMYEQA